MEHNYIRVNSLPSLVSTLRDIVAQSPSSKSLSTNNRAQCMKVLQHLEAFVLGSGNWSQEGSLSDVDTIAQFIDLAISVVLDGPPTSIVSHSWATALDVMLEHAPSSLNATPYAMRLWEATSRLWKSCGSPENDTISASVLLFLRIILQRCPVNIDSALRHSLPQPQSTAGVSARVAAMQLLPFLVLSPKQRQNLLLPHVTQLAEAHTLNSTWAEYLRKGLTCSVDAVKESAVQALRLLLRGGAVPATPKIAEFIDVLMGIAESEEMCDTMQKEVGSAIGYLLVCSSRGCNWTYFAGATAQDSARVTDRLFKQTSLTRCAIETLSIALGSFLLVHATTSVQTIGKALNCLFSLVGPSSYSISRPYLQIVVANAVLRWAKATRSEATRGALAQQLVRFIDMERSEEITKTALICLGSIVATVASSEEYASSLSALLLTLPLDNPSLSQLAAKVLASLAKSNEVSCRALIRQVFALTSNCDRKEETVSPLGNPHFSLHMHGLLSMSPSLLRRPCLLKPLVSLVACLSVIEPPVQIDDAFLYRAECFHRTALVLLLYHRDSLPNSVVDDVRASLRIFLGVLVSSRLAAAAIAYARAAISVCDVLLVLGASDAELKLLFVLFETLEAASDIASTYTPFVRAAVYQVVTRAPWNTCGGSLGRQNAVRLALVDLEEAIRHGIPCVYGILESEEGERSILHDNHKHSSSFSWLDIKNLTEAASCSAWQKEHREEPLLPTLAAAECLSGRERLLPSPRHRAQAVAVRRAVELLAAVASFCDNTIEDLSLLRNWLGRLRKLRNVSPTADPAVAAWNVMCCLDALMVQAGLCSNTSSAAVVATECEEGDWLSFIETNWLDHELWAVRLMSARVLGRLAVITGQVKGFTSAAVYKCDSDAYRLSGVLLALGQMHSHSADDADSTTGIAVSLIARTLKQQSLCGDPAVNAVSAAAVIALTYMAPHHASLVESVINVALVPKLLTLEEQVASEQKITMAIDPLIAALLLQLFITIPLHLRVSDDSATGACAAGIVSYIISCSTSASTHAGGGILSVAMPEGAAIVALNTLRRFVENQTQIAAGATTGDIHQGAPEHVLTPVVSLVGYRKRTLDALDTSEHLGDMLSKAAAGFLAATLRVASVNDKRHLPLQFVLRAAKMIDIATASTTSCLWLDVMHEAVCCVGQTQMGKCLGAMELVTRGKPAQSFDNAVEGEEENMDICAPAASLKRDDTAFGGFDGEDMGMNGDVVGRDEPSETAVTSETPAKEAVLKILTSILKEQREDGKHALKLEGEDFSRFLQLFFASVSLVEFTPSLVEPAAEAMSLLIARYGQQVSANNVPFLHSSRVPLLSCVLQIIDRSTSNCEVGCSLAEAFIGCNVADDISVRRVVAALSRLMAELEKLDAETSGIAHGGCGRVVLVLAKCRARATGSGVVGCGVAGSHPWPQTAQSALEVMASLRAQAATALMCNQITATVCIANGYEPNFDLPPTPLDDVSYVTPGNVVEVLHQMCDTTLMLDSGLPCAAGCLLLVLLSVGASSGYARGIPLVKLRSVVPLLPTCYRSAFISMVISILCKDECSSFAALWEIASTALMAKAEAVVVSDIDREEAERLICSMVRRKHDLLRTSFAPFSLALYTGCSAHCIKQTLQALDVNVLLACEEDKLARAATLAQQRFPEEEERDISMSSVCGFLLMKRDDVTLVRDMVIQEETLKWLFEALFAAEEPSALLTRLFQSLHHSLPLCGTIFSLCTCVKSYDLQQKLEPVIEHALLSSIKKETMQGTPNENVQQRVLFFVRGVLVLLSQFHLHEGPREVAKRYPKVSVALTEQLMQGHSSELKGVIQSLSEVEVTGLRELMKLQSATTAQASATTRTAPAPQRLQINLSSYTKTS
ncbi:hypothetical protein ERJ75_000879300 [Trypanosoma vivax]|nr:hypothetical protein ERJ75_000879300 [Trypanosoma vivax]